MPPVEDEYVPPVEDEYVPPQEPPVEEEYVPPVETPEEKPVVEALVVDAPDTTEPEEIVQIKEAPKDTSTP